MEKLHSVAKNMVEEETYINSSGKQKEWMDRAIIELEKLHRQVFGLKSKVSNLEKREMRKEYRRFNR